MKQQKKPKRGTSKKIIGLLSGIPNSQKTKKLEKVMQ